MQPRAATYWRELAERCSRTARYYRGRTRELARRIADLESENRALRVERDVADRNAERAMGAHADAVDSLKRLRSEIDYLKAVARDLKAVSAEADR